MHAHTTANCNAASAKYTHASGAKRKKRNERGYYTSRICTLIFARFYSWIKAQQRDIDARARACVTCRNRRSEEKKRLLFFVLALADFSPI